MKKITALLYIFILLFTSCEEEVDYDDLGVKNLIVVNATFIDGETPWCQVSRSDIIFDQIKNKITPTVFLPNATVTATDGNSDFKYVTIGDSAVMEAKGLKVKAGETYTLKAKANGLDEVYSTITVPSKPKAEFNLVSVEKESTPEFYYYDQNWGNYDSYNLTYELNIQDDPNTEDYYQILFYANTKQYVYEKMVIDTVYGYWEDGVWKNTGMQEIYDYVVVDSFMEYQNVYYLLETNDPVMNWNKSQSNNNLFEDVEYNETNIFNDQLFNGQTSKIRFSMNVYQGNMFYNINYNDPIYFQLRHINKEMYMYYRTYQKVTDNNDWMGSLSPYMLYCNVENGAGLVAAWSSVKKEIEIPTLEK